MKYKEIYEEILKGINEGVYPPGSKICSEMELSEQYGVSRTTARHVLSQLSGEGFLYRRKKAGTFVSASVGKSADKIAVVIPSEEFNNFEILDSIMSANTEYGYRIDVFLSKLNIERELEILTQILNGGEYEGLILLPSSSYANIGAVSRIAIAGIRVVLIDVEIKGLDLPFVTSDNIYGFYSLVSHLIHRGHRKIAFLNSHIEMNYAENDRYSGYCKALIDHKIPIDEQYVFRSDYIDSNFYNLTERRQKEVMELNAFTDLHRYCSMKEKPTALCFINDMSASYFVEAMREAAVDFPERPEVTGFDNLDISSRLNFTTVSQDFGTVGREALVMLHTLLTETQRVKNKFVKTKLIVRD